MISFLKWSGSLFRQTRINFTKGYFVKTLVEIDPVVVSYNAIYFNAVAVRLDWEKGD